MESATTDRRACKRYPMDIPVRVGSEQGRTRDLSSRGVYVVAPRALEAGVSVEMDLTLTHASAQGPIRLHVLGRVIRVDQLESTIGLAAVIDDWDFQDPGSPAPGVA